MFRIALGLVLLTSSLGASFAPQTTPAVVRPNFSGAWEPADQARSSTLFNVGIGWVPGNGRIVIEQRPNRLTVTKIIPDDVLDPLLLIQGELYPTVMYRIVEPRVGRGGFGAGGDVSSSWQGDRLVVIHRRLDSRLITVSLLLDGERLRMDSNTVIEQPGKERKESTVSQWFVRAK